MNAFLLEVIAAIKDGPRLYFAPVVGAIRAAKQPNKKVPDCPESG